MVTPLSASSVIAMSALMLCMPIQPQQLLTYDCPSELAWQIRVQNSGFRIQASGQPLSYRKASPQHQCRWEVSTSPPLRAGCQTDTQGVWCCRSWRAHRMAR